MDDLTTIKHVSEMYCPVMKFINSNRIKVYIKALTLNLILNIKDDDIRFYYLLRFIIKNLDTTKFKVLLLRIGTPTKVDTK